MGQSAIMAALAAKDYEAIRAAMVGELIPVIPAATDPLTWDPRELTGVGGNTFQVVCWQEKLWFRDETSVAAADEITVITLADGVNYLTNDVTMPEAVISRAVTVPPTDDDSPAVEFGDTYLVPAASSGDWAAHEDDVAIWTARGWFYRPPSIGHLLYIRDELGYIHYSEANAWEDGIGAYALTDGGVRPNHLLIRAWTAENQTTTAPPATGPAGETYIIGPSATGTWSGHDGKIAWRPSLDAAFVITTPFNGEVVYDKSLNVPYRFNGTSWVSAAGVWTKRSHVFTAAAASPAAVSTGAAYSYSASTAPTTSQYRVPDAVTLSHAANRASTGATDLNLRIRYSAAIDAYTTGGGGALVSANQPGVIALFRDSEVNAIAWQKYGHKFDSVLTSTFTDPDFVSHVFLVPAPDTSSHIYTIALLPAVQDFGSTDTARHPSTISRRTIEIEESA